ncbi:uncharacterized protein LOC133187087 [Saccostrea echinata]|uniref:uncharacterized protein LOC133187087 n=1 Tax=Saccostrea echinata TaxID=191078 RepID=UPI002A825B9B|nr:uncharacterized protein LOC133187087 [Saccostrea echinata]
MMQFFAQFVSRHMLKEGHFGVTFRSVVATDYKQIHKKLNQITADRKQNLKLLEENGYQPDSDRNQETVLDWDKTKLEFFIRKLTAVSRRIYICPSLLLYVNGSYHPAGGPWDQDARGAIKDFSRNILREKLGKKIDEVYGNEPFVEEVHQRFYRVHKYKESMEKLELIKQYQLQSNVRIAKRVVTLTKEKLTAELKQFDKSLKEKLCITEEDAEDKEEDNEKELLVLLCKKHSLLHNIENTREIIHILFKFGFKYHEIALADPRIFRIKYINTFVQVLSEMCENTNLDYEKIGTSVEKTRPRYVGSMLLASSLEVSKKHVQEIRQPLRTIRTQHFSRNSEKVVENVTFLKEAGFDPYVILNCLVITNFDNSSLQKAYVDAVKDFDSCSLNIDSSTAMRMSLLCHMYLELSKEPDKPVDLDEIGSEDISKGELDLHPDEDDLEDLDSGHLYVQYSQ